MFAKIIEYFKSLFGTRTVSPPVDIDSTFPTINVSNTASAMGLRNMGETDGRNEIPASDATEFSRTERDIARTINDRYGDACHLYEQQLSAHTSLMNAYLTSSQSLDMSHLEHESGVDVEAKLGAWTAALLPVENDIISAHRDLQDFRKGNSIIGLPVEPAPISSVVLWYLIALVVESVANSVFLAAGDELGLLGGWISALVISGVNLVLAYWVGHYVVPMSNSRSTPKRNGGYFLIVIWIAFVLLWNLGAGHFRDFKHQGMENPEILALAELKSDALGLDSLFSWALFFVGVAIALVSAYRAYLNVGPYPEYWNKYRSFENACAEYASKFEEASDEIRHIQSATQKKADAMRNDVEDNLSKYELSLASMRVMTHRLHRYQSHLEDVLDDLLEIYRTRNKETRATPAPLHFGQRGKVESRPIQPFSDDTVDRGSLSKLQIASQQLMAVVGEQCHRAISQLTNLVNIKERLNDE